MLYNERMENENITLIGMPGAGKSTLGVVLAKKLGYRFIDTDLLIQDYTDKLLSELLTERGVEGFIELENQIVSGLECERHVIATGGSVVYGEEAMLHLKGMGKVVFIDIGTDELKRRISPDLVERGVVMRHGNTLEDLLAERKPLYQKYADITVSTAGMHTLEAVETLYAALKEQA